MRDDNPSDNSELAKHLRFITFTIVVLCAGLTITTSFRPATRIDRAIADFERISTLAFRWDAGLIRSQLHEIARKNKADAAPSPVFVMTDDNRRAVLRPKTGWIPSSAIRDAFPMLGGDPSSSHVLSQDGTRVRTLNDFSKLWDLLSQQHSVMKAEGLRRDTGVLVRSKARGEEDVIPLDTYRVRHDWRGLYICSRTFSHIVSLGETTNDASTFGFAPDGETLVVSLRDQEQNERLFSGNLTEKSPKLRETQAFDLRDHPHFSMCTETGLVALFNWNQIVLRDYRTNAVTNTYEYPGGRFPSILGPSRMIRDVVWSSDGKMAAAMTGEFVDFFATPSMTRTYRSRPKWKFDEGGGYSAVAFSSSGDFAATALTRVDRGGIFDRRSTVRQVALIDTRDWEVRHVFECQNSVASLAFSPDGGSLTAASGTDVVIWDMEDFEQVRALEDAHAAPITCVHYAPDGKEFATTSSDGYVRTWDAESGEKRGESNRRFPCARVMYAPNGKRLVVGVGMGRSIAMDDAYFVEEQNALSYTDNAEPALYLRAAEATDDLSGDMSIEVQVAFDVRAIPVDLRAEMVALSSDEFRAFSLMHNSFEESFPELARQAEGVRDAPLKDVWHVLRSQQELTGEQFEYFGVKIPVALIATYGLWLVVIVEFYFFLHIKALTERLGDNDVARTFPWVGLYPGMWPKVAIVASTCVAPIVAGQWLRLLEVEAGTPWWSLGLDAQSLAFCALVFTVGMCVWQFYRLIGKLSERT